MEETIFSLKNICKSFASTRANRDITLDIKRGSIHGLAGENGSGKSTLASIICGIQKPDSGEMFKDGKAYAPQNPLQANNMRVSMVVQELGVIGVLSPQVNMFLGRTGRFARGGFINISKLQAAAREQLGIWELGDIPLRGAAVELSIENRKLIELARALSVDPDFIILDEISQALSQDNRERLYRFIHKFVAQGRTVLMITHDIEEMMQLCDTVSVLRDGQLISTKDAAGTSAEEVKRLMIGREIEGDYYRTDSRESYSEEVVLQADQISVPGKLHDISFELHKDEILGVCGLSDAGIHDLGVALFGISDEKRSGVLTYKPTGTCLCGPKDIIGTGGAYLSKDRDIYGLMLNASVQDNITLPNAKRLSKGPGFLSPKAVRNLSDSASKDFAMRITGTDQVVRFLSGGNKQKVNLSRWLVKDLKYIILDCPTRGVDVGVKAYIYQIIMQAKKEGMAVLLITDELSEAMGLADRILVLREHKCVGLLSRASDFTEEKIAEVML